MNAALIANLPLGSERCTLALATCFPEDNGKAVALGISSASFTGVRSDIWAALQRHYDSHPDIVLSYDALKELLPSCAQDEVLEIRNAFDGSIDDRRDIEGFAAVLLEAQRENARYRETMLALEQIERGNLDAADRHIERARELARPNAAESTERPTVAEPLRGLRHLGKIALVGATRIRELAALPVAYVWQDIAVAGTVVLIAGAPSCGKTTLLFLILAARASVGEPVELLSRLIEPAPAGQWIVIIEGEHSESSTARKLLKSFTIMGIDDDALNRVIIVARKAVTLDSLEWGDVRTLIAAGLVSDVAIDTVARVAPADPNDEREQVAVFSKLAEAIENAPTEASKPIVWSVAHTRKNDNTGDLSDVSGSVQRTGQADSVLIVKGNKADGRTVSSTVMFPKLREDPDDYPMPITFAIEHGALRVDGVTKDDRPLADRVLEALGRGPLTKSAIATKLGRNSDAIEGALTELFSRRAIQTVEVKVSGRERKAFGLVTGASD